MVRRSAFTMIELVFAIVIIAISVISLPRMTQAVSTGIEGNIVQEAIFAASTELNQAVAASWDENSLVETGANSLARVIDNGNCEDNSSLSTYRQKPGHINQPYHRRCLDANATTIGVSNATTTAINALDDYAKVDGNLSNASVNQAGYKFAYTTTVAVFHNAVTANSVIFDGNPNNDMKKITVTVSNNGVPVTSLTTYSANIGEVDYYKRTY